MRILMLSWEYPPRVVGGLSQHVYYLSRALSGLGHEIHVVTCMPEDGQVGALDTDIYKEHRFDEEADDVDVDVDADAADDAGHACGATDQHEFVCDVDSGGIRYLKAKKSKSGDDVTIKVKVSGGIHVHWVKPMSIDNNDFVRWTMLLNFSMLEKCVKLVGSGLQFDVVHGHDWLVAFCAKSMKEIYGLPLVMTIHATESGRNNGINTEMQRFIHSTECFAAELADRLVVCSNFMLAQTSSLFRVSPEKIAVIPNGVHSDPEQLYEHTMELADFRRQYAQEDEKLVFYIGRLVFEKGVQLLVQAAPEVLSEIPGTRFIIAGSGPMGDELKRMTKLLGVEDRFIFTEYIDEESKECFYRASDAAVFPSLYEPFGIVALEAMNAGCPVVVSDVGGFSEIVHNGVNGLKSVPGSHQSIAVNLIRLLQDPSLACSIRDNAQHHISEYYSWQNAAALTVEVYDNVI